MQNMRKDVIVKGLTPEEAQAAIDHARICKDKDIVALLSDLEDAVIKLVSLHRDAAERILHAIKKKYPDMTS